MIPAGTEADASRPSPLRAFGRGAKKGFRWTSYVVGPAAAVALVAGLALTPFGVGAGRGWGLHLIVPIAPGVYLVFAVFGAILGGVIGLIAALFGRSRPGIRVATFWAAVSRPIRRSRRFTSTTTPTNTRPPEFLRRRWPWLVGASVLLVLAAAFAIGIHVGRLVDRRLAAAVAAADRDDPFWRLADLMARREPVPAAENSALVVAKALFEVAPELARQPRAAWPMAEAAPARGGQDIGEVALQSIRRVLAQGEPSDQALARVQAIVGLEPHRAPSALRLEGRTSGE